MFFSLCFKQKKSLRFSFILIHGIRVKCFFFKFLVGCIVPGPLVVVVVVVIVNDYL